MMGDLDLRTATVSLVHGQCMTDNDRHDQRPAFAMSTNHYDPRQTFIHRLVIRLRKCITKTPQELLTRPFVLPMQKTSRNLTLVLIVWISSYPVLLSSS